MASDNKKQCSLGLSALVTTPFSGNWQFFTIGNPKRNCCPLLPRDDPHGTTRRYFCVVCPQSTKIFLAKAVYRVLGYSSRSRKFLHLSQEDPSTRKFVLLGTSTTLCMKTEYQDDPPCKTLLVLGFSSLYVNSRQLFSPQTTLH